MSEEDQRLPLQGLRVLDFGHNVMGPTAGLVLADLGAEVIHIEPAPGGDPTRHLNGFARGFFPFFNRNKKSLAVDLGTLEGQAIVHRLLAVSDVMLENFAPGAIERLGFGYEEVSARHPHVVYLSLKGYLPGPYQDRPAMDEVVQMMSGLAYMTGVPGQPLRAGASVVDILGGVFGALGILVALRERDVTGRGTLVKSSLFESVMFMMGQHLAYSALTREPVPPMPSRAPAWAIYDVFDTADGEKVFLGITSDRQWQLFCQSFGRPDLSADKGLVSNAQRLAARTRLLPIVAGMMRRLELAQIETRCLGANLPFAPVGRPEQMFQDEHLLAGERLLPTHLGNGTVAGLPALPIEIGNYKSRLRADPPLTGADTRSLLKAVGYEDATIDALVECGILVDQQTEDEGGHPGQVLNG